MAPSGKGGAKTVAPLQVETTIRHDTEGRITGLQHALAAGAALPAGLMLSSVVGPLQASYAYDANGNRTRSNYEQPSAVPGAMDALMRGYQLQDGSNRVLGYTQTSRFGGTASTVSNNFQYDAAGHIISTGTNANAAANDKTYTLRYGASGRLIQAHPSGQPSQASSYLHNLLGQRVLKTSPATGTEPAGMLATLYGEAEHGMESQPLGQYDSAGVPKTEYIYLPTAAGPMPIAVIVGGKKYAVQSDHLNTPRRLVQQNGQVAWQWTYSAFGEVPPTLGATRFVSPLADPGAINTAANPAPVAFDLRYPGQLADAESGLFYNHHRSYDPVMGRYTQSDPIGLAGGWNRFGYVGGNPLSFVDPRGLDNPGMGPYGPGPNRGDGSFGPTQVAGAMSDFWRNYRNMRAANTIGGDKYFHCMANCEATRRGPAGESAACNISDVREWTDQNIKGDPASASLADQAANVIGRSGALSSPQACSAVCSGFRPNGLPPHF